MTATPNDLGSADLASSRANAEFRRLLQHHDDEVIGQPRHTNRLHVAQLAHGHLLVEGAPGLA